jgi:hypothetical protein
MPRNPIAMSMRLFSTSLRAVDSARISCAGNGACSGTDDCTLLYLVGGIGELSDHEWTGSTCVGTSLVEPTAIGSNRAVRERRADDDLGLRNLAQYSVHDAAPLTGPLRTTSTVTGTSEPEPGLRFSALLRNFHEACVDEQIVGSEGNGTITLHDANQTCAVLATRGRAQQRLRVLRHPVYTCGRVTRIRPNIFVTVPNSDRVWGSLAADAICRSPARSMEATV